MSTANQIQITYSTSSDNGGEDPVISDPITFDFKNLAYEIGLDNTETEVVSDDDGDADDEGGSETENLNVLHLNVNLLQIAGVGESAYRKTLAGVAAFSQAVADETAVNVSIRVVQTSFSHVLHTTSMMIDPVIDLNSNRLSMLFYIDHVDYFDTLVVDE